VHFANRQKSAKLYHLQPLEVIDKYKIKIIKIWWKVLDKIKANKKLPKPYAPPASSTIRQGQGSRSIPDIYII